MDADDKVLTVYINSKDSLNSNDTCEDFMVKLWGVESLKSDDCQLYACYLDAAYAGLNNTGTSTNLIANSTGYFKIDINFQQPYTFSSSRKPVTFMVSSNTNLATFDYRNPQKSPVIINKESLFGLIHVKLQNDSDNLNAVMAGSSFVLKLSLKPVRKLPKTDVRIS